MPTTMRQRDRRVWRTRLREADPRPGAYRCEPPLWQGRNRSEKRGAKTRREPDDEANENATASGGCLAAATAVTIGVSRDSSGVTATTTIRVSGDSLGVVVAAAATTMICVRRDSLAAAAAAAVWAIRTMATAQKDRNDDDRLGFDRNS